MTESEKIYLSKKIIDGVEITEYSDGSTEFKVVDCKKSQKKTFWKRIVDFFKRHEAKPYAKVRDFANPFGDRTDSDAGFDGKNGYEFGIKLKF